jgi:hypothetical protein
VSLELVLDFDPSPPTYTIQALYLWVTGTDTVTTPEGETTEEDWLGIFGRDNAVGAAPLPANWRMPAGSASAEHCTLAWTDITPTPAPFDLAVQPAAR